MDKYHLLEQLNLDLGIMKLTVERMRSDASTINQIDLDLLQYKIIQIYDHISGLKVMQSGQPENSFTSRPAAVSESVREAVRETVTEAVHEAAKEIIQESMV